ncbi:MAG: type II/IV secretion system protein [Thermodesulfobacteria bacterium]|nr:type II/IV secretion system protein [Thermodesulfobacteriota bacterium]
MNNTAYNDAAFVFELLFNKGLINAQQLDYLKEKHHIASRKGIDLIQWIDSLGLKRADAPGKILTEADVLEAVCQEKGWSFRRLDPLNLDMEVVTKTLPSSFARTRLVVPIQWLDNVLEVASYYPEDQELKDDIERVCKSPVSFVVAPKGDIERVIHEFFDFRRSITAAEDVLSAPEVDISNLEQYVKLSAKDLHASDKHINKAVDHLFQYALNERASDIHIEPKRKESVVRFRIDGVLHTIYRLPRVVHEALCTRIKALSRLDIAEKRRPQDGRIKLSWKDQDAEVRVSTVPVAFGEKVVLRLQSAEILMSDLDRLGFSESDFATYKKFLQNTNGMILMTGPTGSGKSTTLYSTLRYLSSPDVNIVTVEDPIEMVYEDFNQIAVQPQIDVTFSTILRNILRQDPDIVMIGEIRDAETARYAVQASLTGHLVFSTLHTNDAAGAVTRLKDLGLEPYLIASTLIGVVAQRLVRTICPECKSKTWISSKELEPFGCKLNQEKAQVYYGKGCNTCRKTGYFGRIGIYEVLSVSKTIKDMIHDKRSEGEIKRQALKEGMRTLKFDACSKMLKGITTLDEILRVTY